MEDGLIYKLKTIAGIDFHENWKISEEAITPAKVKGAIGSIQPFEFPLPNKHIGPNVFKVVFEALCHEFVHPFGVTAHAN